MTNRSVRRTLTASAIVVVVLTAVGMGFFLVGRSTANQPPTTPSIAPPTQTDVRPSPTYEPTDQSGSPEPGLESGPAVAGQGGSKAGPEGLPLGYTHDQTGAVNAATNYLTWLNSIKIADKAAADAMAKSAAADPATFATLIESFDETRSGLADLVADQPEPARGAYAVSSFSPSRALIYIWAPEVTRDVNGDVNHLWAIDAVPLVWSGEDWKLDKTLISKIGAAAVDPIDPAGNPTAEEKHSILTRTPADPGQITDSADQTWFEYANAPH